MSGAGLWTDAGGVEPPEEEADKGQMLEGGHRVVGDELVVARVAQGCGCSPVLARGARGPLPTGGYVLIDEYIARLFLGPAGVLRLYRP